MVTRVLISLGGTGESSQPSAQAALGLHSSNSVAFSAVTINSVNVLSNDYATYATLVANDYATYQNALSNAYANDLVTYNALKITVQDEGNQVYTAPSTLNFVGSGVSVSNTGSVVTVTVTGGGEGGGSAGGAGGGGGSGYFNTLYVSGGATTAGSANAAGNVSDPARGNSGSGGRPSVAGSDGVVGSGFDGRIILSLT